jgi:hypothetical protein
VKPGAGDTLAQAAKTALFAGARSRRSIRGVTKKSSGTIFSNRK